MKEKSVLITGADGFLGTHLVAEFAGRGWDVFGLVRNPESKLLPAGLRDCFPHTLEEGPDPRALEVSAEVVIHTAFHTRVSATAAQTAANLEAAQELARHYREKYGSLFLFVSSMSAHDGAFSNYGRGKRAIERALDPARSLIIRPGFVIGPGGIFRRLARTLASTPIAPMPYGGKLPIQTADVNELCRAMADLVTMNATGIHCFGEPDPVPISTFYKAVAAWAGHSITLLPVPGAPVLALARLMEGLGVPLPLTSENLLGLRGLIHQPVENTIEKLGWKPAPFSAILKRYDPSIIQGNV
jgi:nucleoside-diphosphate-sugar epimerase